MALHGDGDIVRGLEAGGDDFLPKPFSRSILIGRAQAALHGKARISGDKVGVHLSETSTATLCLNMVPTNGPTLQSLRRSKSFTGVDLECSTRAVL
jgi:DNA-binding response OmpR family regulator